MTRIKTYLAIASLWALLAAPVVYEFGCATRGTYTTLASTEQAVKLSYDGYVDSVIRGESRTNELPTIAKSFDAFQASFQVAVDKASGDTNAPITGDLSAAAASILRAITSVKGIK